jgi:nitrogen regulatory protein PII
VHFKLIIAFVEANKTDAVLEAARQAGATGSTVIDNAHGEGIAPSKTFLGLQLNVQRQVLLFLVEEHLSREILEKIQEIGEFDQRNGAGIAFQIDVEDAVGVSHQVQELTGMVEESL